MALLRLVLLLCTLVSVLAVHERLAYVSPKITLTQVHGKGMGLVAKHDVAEGELLIDEEPLFELSTQQTWFQPTEEHTRSRVQKQVDLLSAGQKQEFFSLHAFIRQKFQKTPNALDVFRTNAYPVAAVEEEEAAIASAAALTSTVNAVTVTQQQTVLLSIAKPLTTTGAGLFPLISRLNSACAPNVHYSYHPSRKAASVHAISKIQSGKEVLNSYLSLFLTRQERQIYLQTNFGFACDCSVCNLQGKALEHSDERRSALQNLDSLLEAHDYYTTKQQLLAEEGIDTSPNMFKALVDSLRVDVALGKGLEEQKVQRTIALAITCKGNEAREVKQLRHLLHLATNKA